MEPVQGLLPNKRINLSRPTVSVVTWDRRPRRSCAGRSTGANGVSVSEGLREDLWGV